METRISFFVCDDCADNFEVHEDDPTQYWVSCSEADKEHCDICKADVMKEGGYIVSKTVESILRMLLEFVFQKKIL